MVLGGPDPCSVANVFPSDGYRSEYQRQMAGGHSSALTAQSFNRTHFDMRAHRFAMRYALMLDDIRAISESVPEEDVFILRCVDPIRPHPVILGYISRMRLTQSGSAHTHPQLREPQGQVHADGNAQRAR